MSKTALITGASSGIGKALAECFARDRYDVILTARRLDRLEAIAADLKSRYSIQATAIAADLQAADGAQKLHAAVQSRGITLSALVNNAGFGTYGPFHELPLERELAMVQLNVTTVVTLSRLFLPDLIANKGKLMNLASTAAFQAGPYMAVYFASKAFVLNFSEALAAELSGTGVTVTAFCPGPTASGFQAAAQMEESAMVKGKKMPSSEDVAAAGYRAMQSGKAVYIPGFMNWLMAQGPRFVPRAIATQLTKAITKPKD